MFQLLFFWILTIKKWFTFFSKKRKKEMALKRICFPMTRRELAQMSESPYCHPQFLWFAIRRESKTFWMSVNFTYIFNRGE